MRCSIGLRSSPRQYAPAASSSLTAPIWSVRCTCGPRQRSAKPPWRKSVMSSPVRDVGEARDLQRLAQRLEERLRLARALTTSRVEGAPSRRRCAASRPRSREIVGRERALDQEVVLELLACGRCGRRRSARRERGASRRRPSRARPSGGSRRRPAGSRRRHDLERDVARERQAQVDQPAVDAAGERGAREPRADALGDVENASRPRAPRAACRRAAEPGSRS